MVVGGGYVGWVFGSGLGERSRAEEVEYGGDGIEWKF
jgi:hypothetical protein